MVASPPEEKVPVTTSSSEEKVLSTRSTPTPATSFLLPVLNRNSWTGSDSPYSLSEGSSRMSTLNEKYALSPDPRDWKTDLSLSLIEADDDIHNPDVLPTANPLAYPCEKKRRFRPSLQSIPQFWDVHRTDLSFSRRGVLNLGCLSILITGFLVLFIGYPVITYSRHHFIDFEGSQQPNLPSMSNRFALIDPDTPQDAYTQTPYNPAESSSPPWKLVFSDEFNVDGRSFYPGDDPYWEAVDLHYWATNNLEWYDPEAVTTANGSLVITFSEKQTHDLNYQGGLISSWNKFCFTGGLIKASVQLPGEANVVGMWPAIWTMGNLGRAGYGATLDGVWPYSYDACDVGTLPNQTYPTSDPLDPLTITPAATTVDGDPSYDDKISVLPGQKLSACTCAEDGVDHPGPKVDDGNGGWRWVGRAAPEIDMFEGQSTGKPRTGQVSQSAQWAPMNHGWIWQNDSSNMIIADTSISHQNSFIGSATQQATSVVTETDQNCYEITTDPLTGEKIIGQGCWDEYAFEYKPGFDDAYITWVANGQTSWTMNVAGVGPDSLTEISGRPMSQEPMYIIMNLGMSHNFGSIDFEHLTFPNHLKVDWIRVYQHPDRINIGCNPKGFETEAYIEKHIAAYSNPNLTTWVHDYGAEWPGNKMVPGQCTSS